MESSVMPHQAGLLVDPGKPLTFTFDGKSVSALAGQTIGAALYNSGVRAFSRSFGVEPVPEDKIEARLAREIRFDPDVWIVEVEDRAGRHFLEPHLV